MKTIKWAGLLFSVLFFSMISGCSTVKIQDYKNEAPKLDLFTYFNGTTYAQG
ncbi:MAG TPA: DUF3833 family protein, partial [Thiomicrospira sp.]|nr:DUF3833 family protein [Thiomicrospira sp.]